MSTCVDQSREIIDLEKTELLNTLRPHPLKALARAVYNAVTRLFPRSGLLHRWPS